MPITKKTQRQPTIRVRKPRKTVQGSAPRSAAQGQGQSHPPPRQPRTLVERIDALRLRLEFRRLTTFGASEKDRAALLDWLEPYAIGAAFDQARRTYEGPLLAGAEEAEQLITEGQAWIERVNQFNRNHRRVGLSLPLNQAWPHLMTANTKLSGFPSKGRYTLDPQRPSSGRPRLPQPRNFEGLLTKRLDAICDSKKWQEGPGAKRLDLERLARRIASELGLATAPRGFHLP